jgi:ferredoxin
MKGLYMSDQNVTVAGDTSVIVGKYKVTVVRDLCIGAASCVAISSNVFQLDAENKAIIPAGADDSPDNIVMAAQSCPTKAIIVEDTETGERVWPL